MIFDRVGVTFGDVVVFSNLSAIIHDHEVTALVGPSGSGKTTVLGLISGLLAPTSGSVWLETDNGERTPPQARHAIWVPQGGQLLPYRSVTDNAMLGALAEGSSLADAQRLAERALQSVGLAELRHHRAGLLSGGEVQRLAFARALTSSRPLVLADEPTASLDRRNAKSLIEILRHLKFSAAVIVATHDELVMQAAARSITVGRSPAVGSRPCTV